MTTVLTNHPFILHSKLLELHRKCDNTLNSEENIVFFSFWLHCSYSLWRKKMGLVYNFVVSSSATTNETVITSSHPLLKVWDLTSAILWSWSSNAAIMGLCWHLRATSLQHCFIKKMTQGFLKMGVAHRRKAAAAASLCRDTLVTH